jgi:hypothetical protein
MAEVGFEVVGWNLYLSKSSVLNLKCKILIYYYWLNILAADLTKSINFVINFRKDVSLSA